jgi:TPP-dependent indolepyruvate ferredoxin oxidoreductase alpha subunit
MIGGDGWAYDIGLEELTMSLPQVQMLNMLVMDNEVYANTGGQVSKGTPRSAIEKFSAAGKVAAKKDLGFMAMTYGNVYVAQIASEVLIKCKRLRPLKKQNVIMDRQSSSPIHHVFHTVYVVVCHKPFEKLKKL